MGATFLLTLSAASAQSTAEPPRQADIARNQSVLESAWNGSAVGTGESEGTAAAAPKMDGDDEYGEQRVLLRRATWAPWTIEVDAQVFWTDNVALASRNIESDTYLRAGFRAGYSNRVFGNLFVSLGWDYHTVRHSQFPELDFDLGRADASAMLMLPKLKDAFLIARYSFLRLMEAGVGSELYDDHVLSLGLQKIWKISRGQQVFAGIYGDWSTLPDPWPAGRHEFSGSVGWKLRLTDALTVQTSYRLAFHDYRTGQREDWNNVILIGATYALTDWLNLGALGSYSINRSSASVFDYQNLILGAGVAAHWEF